MLILKRWVDEQGGALLQSPTGAEVFRTFDQLEENFYAFEYRSPNGLDADIIMYVHKSMVVTKPRLVAV